MGVILLKNIPMRIPLKTVVIVTDLKGFKRIFHRIDHKNMDMNSRATAAAKREGFTW